MLIVCSAVESKVRNATKHVRFTVTKTLVWVVITDVALTLTAAGWV